MAGKYASIENILRSEAIRQEDSVKMKNNGEPSLASSPESSNRSFLFLATSRAFRSVSVAFSTLALPLFMSALGYGPVIIGLSFLAMTLATVFLLILYGIIGDRKGYKVVLIIVDVLFSISTLMLALGNGLGIIVLAATIGGFGGQGGGGLRGGFGPGSTALVGRLFPESSERVRRIGRLTFVGGIFSIAGSAMLALHGVLVADYGNAGAFRVLYALSSAISVCSLVSILFISEPKHHKVGAILSKESGKFVTKISMSNFISGLGIGMAVPLLPLWFELAYHFTPSTISVVYTASSAVSAFASLEAHRFARFGSQVVLAAASRALNGVLLIMMALPLGGGFASVLYVLRGLSAGIGAPNRSAVTIGGVGSEEMGAATSLTAVANRIALGSSSIGGYLLEVMQDLPLEIGGLLQVIGGGVFYLLLKERE